MATRLYDRDNYELKEELRGDQAYIFDLETDGLLEELTRIHCLVACDLSGRTFCFGPDEIKQGLDLISKASFLIAHNGINFDYPAIKKLYPDFEFPPIVDTLVLSRMIFTEMKDKDFRHKEKNPDYALPQNMFGRHSLESWGYRLGDYKGDFDGGDWKTYTPEMLEYCEQDTLVTLKLYERLSKEDYSEEAFDLEQRFAALIHRQMERGWAFDEEAAGKLYAELVKERTKIKDEMSKVFPGWWKDMKTPEYYSFRGEYQAETKSKLKKLLLPKIKAGSIQIESLAAFNKEMVAGPPKQKHTPFNPGSRHHIYRVFKEKYGWKPSEFTPKGEPKIDETVLNSLEYPEAKILSKYFLLDKRIGQLAEGNQAWLKQCKHGRIHGYVNTLGAVTHRCTHNKPNVAQVPACGAAYGKECRELFRTTKGMTLVGADASGLELRCLAHYMAHWDKGAYAKVLLEDDIHTVNQQAAGLPTRDNAKTFIYAFLYGAGDGKIGSIVGGSFKTGKDLRAKFLKGLPALGKLTNSVKSASKKGYIRGLDGRKLIVRSQHSALNTLLQSAGAIVMKRAAVIADDLLQGLYEPGVDYEFVGNIHDEVQIECRPDIADDIGETVVNAIQMAGEHYKYQCPLDGEYKKGSSWAKTH